MTEVAPAQAAAADCAALRSLVGNSPALAALREKLPRIAASACNVLITGETGTGKECVARAVHELSPRRRGPYISINCAALPDSLLDSELFGFERGAFTGANTAYPGKIALADGGTLFLDEIGDMPPHAQAKLLRVLETHEVFPIGALRSRRVDFRTVAATHCGLEQAMHEGRFRADLFYRLNVARVVLPPLRERPEDVLVLFEHFSRGLPGAAQQPPVRLTAAAMARLCRYAWPGNAREVRNLVEALSLQDAGLPMDTAALPLPPEGVSCAGRSDAIESARILEALNRCEWNRSKAAELLDWSRMTLYRKMKQFHIAPAPGQ
ncbi:sigma-54 dependent transcriptional regulator [Ramlibacter sp.]|uniref:sigma-54 interaction domain-containing protein n=1 Tax=Ramlibacter sp. TaxID=1917967 RepID=UPI0017E36ECB|nr:sigma-54 dependent transcriptional regulator [Ramlibacter sp.]MBA2675747.1 sigma-54-dependent Fis family transcriptional regulator [Ramlibacter sp.]